MKRKTVLKGLLFIGTVATAVISDQWKSIAIEHGKKIGKKQYSKKIVKTTIVEEEEAK